MQTVRFFGRIFPAVVNVAFTDIRSISFGTGDLKVPFFLSSRITDSQIEVVCEIEEYKDEYLSVW